MSWLRHEWRLLTRSRLALCALALLLLLSTLAVLSGLREISSQRQTLDRLAQMQQQEMAAQAGRHAQSGDAGSVAYYGFHSTWDAPSSTAFLALGLRDAAPYVLRVRALALQAQLHEGESFNPELALAGRFDFAFVLVYLAPLFLIALLYDLVSGERESGRLGTLQAMPGSGRRLWLRRAGLRSVLLLACLALPALAGHWPAGAGGRHRLRAAERHGLCGLLERAVPGGRHAGRQFGGQRHGPHGLLGRADPGAAHAGQCRAVARRAREPGRGADAGPAPDRAWCLGPAARADHGALLPQPPRMAQHRAAACGLSLEVVLRLPAAR